MAIITKEIPTTGLWQKVLDSGYVRIPEEGGKLLILGSDLTVTNSARTSFLKESDEFSESDRKLLYFLWNRKETEPFRHCFMTFEIKAPLLVCRQHWRYAVGSNHGEYTTSWSEASKRYLTMDPEFYIPGADEWRSKPANAKQGSDAPLPESDGEYLRRRLITVIDESLNAYETAVDMGVALEQARLFLPSNGIYTTYRWSCSLGSLLHFLKERLEDKAQYEIRQYAQAIKDLIQPFFPVTIEALLS